MMVRSADGIERLRASVSIAAVIGETLQLRRDGRHHVALCPFHDKKQPPRIVDFSVSMKGNPRP
jgi:DNA primase